MRMGVNCEERSTSYSIRVVQIEKSIAWEKITFESRMSKGARMQKRQERSLLFSRWLAVYQDP